MDTLPPRSPGFAYAPMFPLGERDTPWTRLNIEGVSVSTCDGQTVLRVQPEALTALAFEAFHAVSHLLRPGHLASANIAASARRRPCIAPAGCGAPGHGSHRCSN